LRVEFESYLPGGFSFHVDRLVSVSEVHEIVG
jgi:hypothetical protein